MSLVRKLGYALFVPLVAATAVAQPDPGGTHDPKGRLVYYIVGGIVVLVVVIILLRKKK